MNKVLQECKCLTRRKKSVRHNRLLKNLEEKNNTEKDVKFFASFNSAVVELFILEEVKSKVREDRKEVTDC